MSVRQPAPRALACLVMLLTSGFTGMGSTAHAGDPAWLVSPLQFSKIKETGTGDVGERWTMPEIIKGDHITAWENNFAAGPKPKKQTKSSP